MHTAEDGADLVERFNGFHDGFVSSVVLRSHDRFEALGTDVTDIVHRLTGEFDVVLEFAHYNYDDGSQPPNRVVRAMFRDVRDFHLDLREVHATEWPIQGVELPVRPGPEVRFALTITWGKFRDGQWSTQQATLFTFADAEFTETMTGSAPDD